MKKKKKKKHDCDDYWSFDRDRMSASNASTISRTNEDEAGNEHGFDAFMHEQKRKHFFVFTNTGRPVWSRYGDLGSLASLIGLLGAICAVAEEEEEEEEEEDEFVVGGESPNENDDDDETRNSDSDSNYSESPPIETRDRKQQQQRRDLRTNDVSSRKSHLKRSGRLEYVEKWTKSGHIVRLAIVRKGRLRFCAVSTVPMENEHMLRIQLDLIEKAFIFLFSDAIEMNLKKKSRFDARRAFIRDEEDVFLKACASSCSWDLFSSSFRTFKALHCRKDIRLKITDTLRECLDKCGDNSKNCFAVIFTEKKGVVAYASPSARLRGVFETNQPQQQYQHQSISQRPSAEDVWYLMQHCRTSDRFKSNKNRQDDSDGTTQANKNATNENENENKQHSKHKRSNSEGFQEIVLPGGGVVVKPPPPSVSNVSDLEFTKKKLERLKKRFCDTDAYDMSICLPSGEEFEKFVCARTMKVRLNDVFLNEYDDVGFMKNNEEEFLYLSIVTKTQDAASRAHDCMDMLFLNLHSRMLMREIFLATTDRMNDIANVIAPEILEQTKGLAEYSEVSGGAAAVSKLEHFVYNKPLFGQYQTSDDGDNSDDDNDESAIQKKRSKKKQTLRNYARMHSASHYENKNYIFYRESCADAEEADRDDIISLESSVSNSLELSPQQSSAEKGAGGGFFGGFGSSHHGMSPARMMQESNKGNSPSPSRSSLDASMLRRGNSSEIADKLAAHKLREELEELEEKLVASLKQEDKAGVLRNSKPHRVRFESDSFGVRIACFGHDFELFCNFKENTSVECAISATNLLCSYLKTREDDAFVH
jgi:hypothetical protein